MGVEDDSCRKQGAVPFKWEIKPGVPIHHHNHNRRHQKPPIQSPEPPSPKLRPPPADSYSYSYTFSPVEPRTGSFRSAPRVRSDRWRIERPFLARPEVVTSGCFFSPLLRRLTRKKTGHKRVGRPDNKEPGGYVSEVETVSRLSWSSRKSASPFRTSTSSSSLVSSPVPDSEWAGFALF